MPMIKTYNTDKAEALITAITKRTLEKKDIRTLGIANTKGLYRLNGADVLVAVDCSLSTSVAEAVFVHEALHALTQLEGFPRVSVNQARASKQHSNAVDEVYMALNSVINHPVVIPRMATDFDDLDMNAYLDMEAEEKTKLLDHLMANPNADNKSHPDYWYIRQLCILWGLDYFLYGDERRDKLLAEFHKRSGQACKHCKELHSRVDSGFSNPVEALSSAKTIKNDVIAYAAPKFPLLNGLWDAVEIGYHQLV